MSRRAPVSWTHPRILSGLLAVFLCGAVSGALAYKLFARQSAVRAAAVLKTEAKAEWLSKFRAELELTETQVEKVEIVLDDSMKYVQDLQNQMDDVRGHGKEQILKILTPKQRQQFERMLADAQLKRLY
jgi:Spy/CpxP family protein refolding chaperone